MLIYKKFKDGDLVSPVEDFIAMKKDWIGEVLSYVNSLKPYYIVEFPSIEEWDGQLIFCEPHEIELATIEPKKAVCECGNPKNPAGQGHSGWCKLFRQEF